GRNRGELSEHVGAQPAMTKEVRTGWVVGDEKQSARAMCAALNLDDATYRTMAARARHFAEYMFAPHSAARATHAVYSALLQRDLEQDRKNARPISAARPGGSHRRVGGE